MAGRIKNKWFGTIIVSVILLTLAMTGGEWGSSYAADDSTNAPPLIASYHPSKVPVRSLDTEVFIFGANFGDISNTAVKMSVTGIDQIFIPETVTSDAIRVVVPESALTTPILYQMSVVKSTAGSIPTIPVTPWDEESNPVPFRVLRVEYYPVMLRDLSFEP